MSVWQSNLRSALRNHPVLLLHGNVRDRYLDADGRLHENLTDLLETLAAECPLPLSERAYYDPVGRERRRGGAPAPEPAESGDELEATGPRGGPAPHATPERVLASWLEPLSTPEGSRLAVLHYLDKLVAYRPGYSAEEMERLLRLEKLIENITPNNRLVLVALQDAMVPLELYANAPKVRLIAIPLPDRSDRDAYLAHAVGEHPQRGLVADLTDGLFLRDLEHIAADLREQPEAGARDARRIVNHYRLGEREDHWAALSIERLGGAFRWFTEEEGLQGQDEPVRRVIDLLCLARAGLTGVASGVAAKPRGALFFAGPTGVGKTFLAKKLAKFLFGTEDAFLRFDMSEFKEDHTVSKLIGSPPGYVGFERGGMLTNAVRERPFSVLLFDEIEKAHPRILDKFLNNND